MIIGIDISQAIFEGTGVGDYTRFLVDNLLKIDSQNQYVLFGSSYRGRIKLKEYASRFNNFNNVTVKILPFPPIFLEWLWNHLHIVKIERLIGRVDVFFSSDWLQPPVKAKKVTTLHDLIVLKIPDSFAKKGGHDIVVNQKRRLNWVKKECDVIICDSLSTKKDAIELLGIPEHKLQVVYLGGPV